MLSNQNQIIRINKLSKIYKNKKTVNAVDNVDFSVIQGEIFGLLGPNGAGKTTILKAISGLLRTEEGEVTDGGVYYEGKPIHKFYPEDIARMGILQVMEGRRLAEHLTVEENLRAGGLIIPKSGADTKKDLEMVYGSFGPGASHSYVYGLLWVHVYGVGEACCA
jgi:branched-chain amino acid transport system ATP-binding protein